jgi:GH15 family glucan-1,4-alpha-glucosidase
MLSTLDATLLPPERGGLVSNSLVYRYNVESTADGVAGDEGTFNICTFWLVEALTRAGRTDRRRLERARLMFEQMLGYANHLGLYAEETGPRGEALGNFPQAFTHLALISAAYNLDRTLGLRR